MVRIIKFSMKASRIATNLAMLLCLDLVVLAEEAQSHTNTEKVTLFFVLSIDLLVNFHPI